ncbi:MAG: hypothetical protein ACXU8N_04645 [Telluria sp.]
MRALPLLILSLVFAPALAKPQHPHASKPAAAPPDARPSVPVTPIEQLKPMGFLAGHCWRGEVPATMSSDEHCFAWLLGGRALRDTHVMRTPGQPDLAGETTYYWNPVAKSVEYFYIESNGTYSRGLLETTANTLYFPPSLYGGEQSAQATTRAHWTPQGETSYDSWVEKQDAAGQWTTSFKMTMKRVR